MTRADLDWFRSQAVTFDIFGANFYPWSYGELIRKSNGLLQQVSVDTSGEKIGTVIQET